MSDCCDPTFPREAAGSEALARCPLCGRAGRNVPEVTLQHQLKPQALERLMPLEAFAFCPEPACDLVYFSAQQRFIKSDLKAPVFQKDPAGNVPVCYCFGYTRAEAAADGNGMISKKIAGYLRDGACSCQTKNPQGGCCLGNVRSLASGS